MMANLQTPRVDAPRPLISLESMQHELAATTSEVWSMVAMASLRGEASLIIAPWEHTPSGHPLHARFERLSQTVEAAFNSAVPSLTHATCDDPCYDEVRLLVNTTADALTALLREIRVMAQAARSGELRISSCDTVSDLLEHLMSLVDRAFQSTVEVADALERSSVALN